MRYINKIMLIRQGKQQMASIQEALKRHLIRAFQRMGDNPDEDLDSLHFGEVFTDPSVRSLSEYIFCNPLP